MRCCPTLTMMRTLWNTNMNVEVEQTSEIRVRTFTSDCEFSDMFPAVCCNQSLHDDMMEVVEVVEPEGEKQFECVNSEVN